MSSNIKKDAIASYTNLFLSIIAGIILVPIIESKIGKNHFGIYQFIFTLTAYTAIMNMGLTKTVERYVAKFAATNESERESLVVSMVITIYLMAALVLGALIAILYTQFGSVFVFTENELTIAKQCFLLASINATLNIPAMSFLAHLKGRGRFVITYNFHTIYILTRMIFVIVFLNLGFGIVTIFALDLILTQTMNLSYMFVSVNKYKLHIYLFRFDKELFAKLFQFTFFISLGSIGDLLYYNTDNIILGIFTDAETIAEYGLAQSLLTYFIRYTTAFTGLLLPRFMEANEKVDDENRMKHLGKIFTDVTRIHGFIMSFAVVNFIVFGRDLIYLWVGNDYGKTYTYALILILPMWIVFSQVTGIELLYVINRLKVRMGIYIFNAFVNIILTIILVQKYGPLGAAISTAITMILGSIIVLNIYYSKLFEINLWKYFQHVFVKNLAVSSILIGFGLVANKWFLENYHLNNTFITLMARGIAFNIIFVLAIAFIWLEKDERKFLLHIRS